jgi:hypothetical protein
LIEGYLDSVRQVLELSRLPGAEAASILDDVRTQILDTLAARAQGTPTLTDAEAVIAELDPPESYATTAGDDAGVGVDGPSRTRLQQAGWAAIIVAVLTIPSFILDLVATFDENRMLHLLAIVPMEVVFVLLYPFAVLTFKGLLNSRIRDAGISSALYVCAICNIIFSVTNILIPSITLGDPAGRDLDGLHVLLILIVLLVWGAAHVLLGVFVLQRQDSLWGLQKLFGWVSIATGLGQMATLLILPIPVTILLLTAQIMLMGFVMLRSISGTAG